MILKGQMIGYGLIIMVAQKNPAILLNLGVISERV
jgi:hypothetical protein